MTPKEIKVYKFLQKAKKDEDAAKAAFWALGVTVLLGILFLIGKSNVFAPSISKCSNAQNNRISMDRYIDNLHSKGKAVYGSTSIVRDALKNTETESCK